MILLCKVFNFIVFGVVKIDDNGWVLRLVEKFKVLLLDLVFVGVYLFFKKIYNVIVNIKFLERGELEIIDVI